MESGPVQPIRWQHRADEKQQPQYPEAEQSHLGLFFFLPDDIFALLLNWGAGQESNLRVKYPLATYPYLLVFRICAAVYFCFPRVRLPFRHPHHTSFAAAHIGDSGF